MLVAIHSHKKTHTLSNWMGFALGVKQHREVEMQNFEADLNERKAHPGRIPFKSLKFSVEHPQPLQDVIESC